MIKLNSFQFPDNFLKIKTIDMHTGGEPLRVIVDGLPEIKGESILDKRRYFQDNFDTIRKGLMWEPRGHADMYGAVITEAVQKGSDFGTFFMHNEGYSTMCGHAIIALTKLVLESGMVSKSGDNPQLIIDAPPGKIIAFAKRKNNVVERVSFINVPSFVYAQNQQIFVEEIGNVNYDIAFGGAFYAIVDAQTIGLSLDASNYIQLIDWGRKIKLAIIDKREINHPFEKDLSFLYGTIFTGKADNQNHHSKNVCVFANGEVDRSATGSGVSARAALHYAKGELKIGESIRIASILNSTMDVEVLEEVIYGNFKAVIPKVSGTAYFTGKHEFIFEPADPLLEGFLFR
ncbi:MAG: proline racemase family protein [Bacteroidota bacterium]